MQTVMLHEELSERVEAEASASSVQPGSPELGPASAVAGSEDAQRHWSRTPINARLRVLRRARHALAGAATQISAALSSQLSRTEADTMVSELLPLLGAIQFLERNAPRLLRERRLGRRGLPFWLSGVNTEIHRVPFGRVLVIGASNYPLFLPGVQVFQALAAGNAVIWKPGQGGAAVAHIVADILVQAGLPKELLEVTDDSPEAAQKVISSGIDKVFFTGSGTTGRSLLKQLASSATPCVLELSGNDAAIVLPSADLDRVVAALAFGMRLNGSATCMAPRRILLVDCDTTRRGHFIERLQQALADVPAVILPLPVRGQLLDLVVAAEKAGATILGDPGRDPLQPILVLGGTPQMEVAKADIFAPVLTLIEVRGTPGILEAQAACPLALTTSIFGDEREARTLAGEITSGTVTINDLIVPTADPRIPFGGRRGSGFGVTRGAEGLLEMTAVKVVATRRSRSTRHYEPTGEAHLALFSNIISATHAGTLGLRWTGIKRAVKAAMEFKKK